MIVKDIGIENLLNSVGLTFDDSILYLGGRIGDNALYPADYVKYLNQKIKELNPKYIIVHSPWYAWKYYDVGVLDESTNIDMIVCYYHYLKEDDFDPLNKEDYQGSHRWCMKHILEKNPSITIAAYDVNLSCPSEVEFFAEWFEGYNEDLTTCTYFKFDRRGDHGKNCTDGFAILTNFLKTGFVNLSIAGFSAFGSDEDDSYFTKYSTSVDSRVNNKSYFQLQTSEDQRQEADILKEWTQNKCINNLENYEILTQLRGTGK